MPINHLETGFSSSDMEACLRKGNRISGQVDIEAKTSFLANGFSRQPLSMSVA